MSHRKLPQAEKPGAYVDIPDYISVRIGDEDEDTWVNLCSFEDKAEAIKWAQEHLGADEQGRITVVKSA